MSAQAVPVVLLPVAGGWYAVEVAVTREVVAVSAVTALPGAGDEVVGLLSLRGEVVPLFQTAALLGLDVRAVDLTAYAVVVQTGRGPAALAVDGLPEAVALPGVTGRGDLPSEDTRHIVEAHGEVRTVTLLNMERLFRTVGGT